GLAQTMSLGTQLQLFGEVKVSRYGKQIHHPEYQVISSNEAIVNTGLQPIYPSVKGLHQNKLRTLIKLALQTVRTQGLPMTVFTLAVIAVVAELPLAPFEHAKLARTEDDFPDDIFSTVTRRVPDNSISNIVNATAVNDMATQYVYNLSIFEALVLPHTP